MIEMMKPWKFIMNGKKWHKFRNGGMKNDNSKSR